MSKENERHFRKANKDYKCNKLYTEKDLRVRDHCHITGEYRDSIHIICNANFRLAKKMPVIFHNHNEGI